MKETNAILSIGLPVYNGEAYIRESIESILGQSFGDYTLLISDNASTDGTSEICRQYAAMDKRIRYHCHPDNLGAAANFNSVFEGVSSKYFKWCACDDRHEAGFLEKTIALLEREPSAVLSFCRVDRIDASGHPMEYDIVEPQHVDSDNVVERFAELVLVDHWCLDIWGVMRTDVLRKTPVIASYIGSDRVLLAELGLAGRFVRVPEVLFHSRKSPKQSIYHGTLREWACWFDPENKNKLILPRCAYLGNYWRAVKRSGLPVRQKLACMGVLARWAGSFWRPLGGECKIYLKHKLGIQLQP
jgi:glycosyltransferase involved in cell wall biosynthesis